MKYRIAIVGATGVVGKEVLKILGQRNLTDNIFLLYADEKSVGKYVELGDKKLGIKKLDNKIFEQRLDFAIFCCGGEVSCLYVKGLAKSGTRVIDFSEIYRKDYPLIVPEINGDLAKGNIICNPNCSTIAAVMALNMVHKKYGLRRIVYSTYQAVSGAGKLALKDMKASNPKELKKFKFVIKNNLIPYIGELDSKGYSTEENKMVLETKKILGDKNIKVTATCVRVPIDICHSESINFETKKYVSIKDLKNTLIGTSGVKVVDDYPTFPMPILTRGGDDVLVGRIRKDYTQKNTFNIFVCSDNLRKGAAQNGVQILELLMGVKR